MRMWKPLLVGESLDGGLPLDGLNVRLLRPGKERFFCRLKRHTNSWFWFGSRKDSLSLSAADLFHVHFGTYAVDIWPLVRELNVPILITLHGYDINIYREWWESGKGGIRRIFYPRRLLEIAHHPQVHFIAVSEAIRDRALQYGIAPEKITVHYIGVDTEFFRPGQVPISQRLKRILFVGRQVEKKGCDILIRAFSRIQGEFPDAQLVVIGDGPLGESHKKLASTLGARVEFLGSLSPSRVKEEIDRARVFCLPSITAVNGDAEGLPISILEAQASGLPVITSARGGATEGIVDGLSGFVIPEGDEMALAEKLSMVLSMSSIDIEKMSKEARNHVLKRFDLVTCTRELEDFYFRMKSTLSVKS